jgi:glyoxylase-like metal-dependent hydrolase (beta-lactamase superfamily II)
MYSTEAAMARDPIIQSSFEAQTGTWQYVVADPSTKKAVIIDSVLDYDPKTNIISTGTADALLQMISENDYQIDKILETHAHADHLTAASYLQRRLFQKHGFKPPICIGRRIKQIQELFAGKYGIPADEYERVFDHLFEDNETFKIGELTAKVIHLPGHTPDHIGYQIGGECLHRVGTNDNSVLIRMQAMCSAVIPSSTRTLGQRAATSLAAAQRTCTTPGENYLRFQMMSRFGLVMIIRPA